MKALSELQRAAFHPSARLNLIREAIERTTSDPVEPLPGETAEAAEARRSSALEALNGRLRDAEASPQWESARIRRAVKEERDALVEEFQSSLLPRIRACDDRISLVNDARDHHCPVGTVSSAIWRLLRDISAS